MSSIGPRNTLGGLAAVVGLANFWILGIVGFLFSLPPSNPQDGANQSLEEVSDWLTKLIIGAGLVESKNVTGIAADAEVERVTSPAPDAPAVVAVDDRP